ncbi:hypothetical protein ACIQU6_40040 [Streptomyces sp. NPDC090442]|uniref:hypothetical protein n=1 Tax=Streptomyces sp. NPDC090442 TaxID=3365962 RepID=UPI0037F814E2
MSRQYVDRGLTVPHIARWSAERNVSPPVVAQRGEDGYRRLGYGAAETLYDRDQYGVLWVCWSLGQGKGRAQFPDAHPLRQRAAVLHERCQVCRQPAQQRDGRYLYLFVAAAGPVYEGLISGVPPVCTTCTPLAVRDCPHLARGYVAVWVADAPLWGVEGIRYHPRTLRPRDNAEFARVEYGSAEARWTLAHRQLVSLHGITPVTDIDAVAPAGPPAPAPRPPEGRRAS